MEKKEFEERIKEYALEMNINISNEQIEKFYNYMQLLLDWNEKINLTAIIEPKEIILKHFIDSLTILKYIEKDSKVIDVGTGAGFPGVPLKIMRDDIEITLLDSLNKRINFLEEVIKQLELTKIQAIHGRAEEFGKKQRESFDIVTSRAVANLSTLSEYLVPLAKIGGKCICMKSMNIEEELNQAQKAISLLGGNVENIEKFLLPKSEIERSLIIINKVKNTPSKYPRKPGTPAKQPLI